jgi:hypothetical protein
MIASRIPSVIVLSTLLLAAGCTEDPEAAANELFVEAASAIKNAEELDATTVEAMTNRRDLLAVAVGNLDEIVSEYPSSSLAVDLASLGAAKGIEIKKIRESLGAATHNLMCLEDASDDSCVVDRILQEELNSEFDLDRRTAVVTVMAANARWDDAFTLIQTMPTFEQDPASRNSAVRITLRFGFLFGEPTVELRVHSLLPDYDKQGFGEFVLETHQKMTASGWKRSSELSPTFVLDDSTMESGAAAELFRSLRDELGDLVLAGDMDRLRTAITKLFLLTQASEGKVPYNDYSMLIQGATSGVFD